ncbi:MAG: hypothetical protein NWF05_05170 [Candidatus Bathyarchaeota archaeon]|nr:hypothetical protein [Candidatus Bathyarchaeota archaeon]
MAPLVITLASLAANYFLFHYPLSRVIAAIVVTDLASVLSIKRKQKNRFKIVDLGWVPKDMNLPTQQQTTPHKASGYKLKMWVSICVTLAVVWGIQGALSPAYAPERSWSLYFTATGIIIGVSSIILLVRIKQTRPLRKRAGASW